MNYNDYYMDLNAEALADGGVVEYWDGGAGAELEATEWHLNRADPPHYYTRNPEGHNQHTEEEL